MKTAHTYTLVIGVLLLSSTAAGLFGVSQLERAIGTYETVVAEDYRQERTVASALSTFKTQVQEWKNVLLRGHDPKQLEKYWAAFQTRETTLRQETDSLLETLPEGEPRELLTSFSLAHAAMGVGYRRGFDAFVEAGFEAPVGDAAVK